MSRRHYPFAKSASWKFVKLFDLVVDFLTAHRKQAGLPENPARIIVIRLDHIGDAVCSSVVFEELKRRYPAARISALVGEAGEAILAGHPAIDEFIAFRANWFRRGRGTDVRELFRIAKRLRTGRFDIGFDLRGDLRNILLMTAGGVRFRVGYGIAGGGGLLHLEGAYDESLHQVELNMKLLGGVFPDRRDLEPKLYLKKEESEWAQDYLRAFGVQPGESVAAIHPEAGNPAKEWGADRFEALAARFISETGFKILILGIEAAQDFGANASGSERIINLSGKLSLRRLAAVLSCCDLFVGNDSGPSHMAHALGVPAVVIASGTNVYGRWGIWREPSRIISHSVPCAPCHLVACNVAGHPCMSGISVDAVMRSAAELSRVER